MKRKQKERRAEAAKLAQKEARGDFSHLKNKKGELVGQPLPQPTLPSLSVDDDDDSSSVITRGPPPSTYSQDQYYHSEKGMDYPPMPAYNPYSLHPNPGAPHINPSMTGFDELGVPHHGYGYEENESTMNLTSGAAAFARDPIDRQNSPYGSTPSPSVHGGAVYDPTDVYQGRAGMYTPAPQYHQQTHGLAPPAHHGRAPSASSGLAYDDTSSVSDQNYRQQPHNQPQATYNTSPTRGYDEESGYQQGYHGYGHAS